MLAKPPRLNLLPSQREPRSVHEPGANLQQQGFSLIECLVAIIMVALVASAIAPALVISVATRVHSQRAEQALALAQSEIEQIRVLVERGDITAATAATLLPPLAAGLADAQVDTAPAPVNLLTDLSPTAPLPNATQAKPVDLDNDGEIDFFVQRYRAVGQVSPGGVPVAFAMGVRVYDRSATGNLSIVPASLMMTSNEAGRRTRPMAALYTTMATSNQGESLCNMITYFNASVPPAQARPIPTLCSGVAP